MLSILEEYEVRKSRYESYAKSLRSLLDSLIIGEGLNVHSISSRVKDKKSLEGKIKSKGTYNEIDEITDVVGVRIITHFSNEVDLIAEVIEREFDVDRINSIDKRSTLEPDRFGYLSLHYIVSLANNRCRLKEYLPYENFKAEIQIRSILQHTWAEIEHDIGYKSAVEVPSHIKRKFSRLAGLLELADEEFVSIKESLSKYAINIAHEMQENPKNKDITLDKISYHEYLKQSPLIKSFISDLFEKTGVELTMQFPETIAAIKQLHYNDIISISDLDDAFSEYREKVMKRAIKVLNRLKGLGSTEISSAVLGIYLAQAIAARNNNKDELIEFLNTINRKRPKNVDVLAQDLLDTFNS